MAATEIEMFGKMGFEVTRKIYFTSNPNVNEGHSITITEREGTAIADTAREVFDVVAVLEPDASVGTETVFRVFCRNHSGSRYNESELADA